MVDAGAVDCLQGDVTRCGGISRFVAVGALTDARSLDILAHTASRAATSTCCGRVVAARAAAITELTSGPRTRAWPHAQMPAADCHATAARRRRIPPNRHPATRTPPGYV